MRSIYNKLIPFLASIECIVFLILALFISLYFTACTPPRSSIKCYDEIKLKYVTCPDGYNPGDIISKDFRRTK